MISEPICQFYCVLNRTLCLKIKITYKYAPSLMFNIFVAGALLIVGAAPQEIKYAYSVMKSDR